MSTHNPIFGAIDDALFDEDFLAGPDESFGALNSPSLAAELAYGALSSPSLTAEYEYGLDDDDDDDDDDDYDDELDEFGGDYEWFGADDFDDLEAEIDAEFGAWYGFKGPLAPVEGVTADELQLIADAFYAGFLFPENLQGGNFEWAIEWAQKAITGNQGLEIAAYLTHEPGFRVGSVTPQMVKEAVKNAAVPGMEAAWDEPLKDWWQGTSEQQGWWDWITGAPGAALESVMAYVSTDIPTAINAMLTEANITDGTEQIVNSLAMGIYFHSLNPLIGDKIYAWIADKINKDAASAVAPREEVFPMPVGPMPGPMPGPIDVAPPAAATGLPRPSTILAFGYALMSGAAALGLK
jgi:hypothetical protein